MLQIAICDDEKYYREEIRRLVEDWLEEKGMEYAIHLFASGEEFLIQNENLVRYDCIFMDINMNEIDGIEAAMQIRSYHSKTQIVFVTAFIQYVLEGYKVDAVRYIMKDTLKTAVPECMDAVWKRLRLAQVTFHFVEGEKTLYTDNILYVESRRHKSIFHYMESGMTEYQIYSKLDEIEQKLYEYGFLRIHKSYLVNMKHMRRVSNYEAMLDNGECLSVPRLRFQKVKEAYVEYKRSVVMSVILKCLALSFMTGIACKIFFETLIPRRKMRYGWMENTFLLTFALGFMIISMTPVPPYMLRPVRVVIVIFIVVQIYFKIRPLHNLILSILVCSLMWLMGNACSLGDFCTARQIQDACIS
ncbi:MAG: LytR/AlgR family response regulator transcription factor [[Clostridium] scindens]